MPLFGMMWRCVLVYDSTPSLHCSSLFSGPATALASKKLLGGVVLHSPGILVFAFVLLGWALIKNPGIWYWECSKMFEDVWKTPLIFWLCITVWPVWPACWDCLSCYPQAPFVWNQGDTGRCKWRYVWEVKEVNQLTEMNTVKSHKMKNDEVAIKKMENLKRLAPFALKAELLSYAFDLWKICGSWSVNLHDLCRTFSLEQVVDPKPDVCCRPSCVWSCFDFYPNDRCGHLVTLQFCHKN